MENRNNEFNIPGVVPGFGEREKKFYDDIESMITLRVKSKLFSDINVMLSDVAKQNRMYPALGRHAIHIRNRALKDFDKSYKAGLKEINKKIPVFVELPKYEKKGDGYTKKEGETALNKTPDTKAIEDEIIVNDLLQGSSSQKMIENTDGEVI